MADHARQPRPDLTAGLEHAPDAFDMFELLRRLEADGRLFGEAGRPDREPARLGQHPRLGFAVADVVSFSPATDRRPARVTITDIGLLGPEGPMPIHLTRWVMDRLSQRWFAGAAMRETSDTTFLDFVNVLQHRMIALFYRAWADCHPAVQAERGHGGRTRAMLAALSGIGLPGAPDEQAPWLDAVRLRQAAALAHQVDGPERLTRYLAEAFGVPVAIEEFVGAWMPIPVGLQTRIGAPDARLGLGATIGPRVFQRQSRVELRLGPLTLSQYGDFLPGGPLSGTLRRAIRDMVGDSLDVDVRLVLRGRDVPPGRVGASRLGRTGWLAPPVGLTDAGDLLMRAFVGHRPGDVEAAA
jgi:type VI secretion system protein ImpH